MNKINKFLQKLSPKERARIEKIVELISKLQLEGLDIKALKGKKKMFRVRKGNYRILFIKEAEEGVVFDINFRKDIYKT